MKNNIGRTFIHINIYLIFVVVSTIHNYNTVSFILTLRNDDNNKVELSRRNI